MIGAELYPAAVRSGAPDLDSRVKLAANPATPPSLLAGLAADGAITVRAAVALNPSLPDSAQRQLARDSDERVRLLLTRKLAGALPGLSGPDESELRERTLGILTGLVRDEAVRIRSAVAASLAGLPDVPHDVILTLAHDHAVEVSGPVLRLSPLLSTADLLELVAAPPHGGTAVAIACRANLPASVADAIAATADSPAICALLANGSAAIQEGTLDALIACAADEPGWHTPLVHRPRLPDHAARALAEIVAGHLLQELATRTDLSAEVIAGIQHRLNAPAAPTTQPGATETDLDHITQARHLEGCGTLGEAQLLAALRAGDNRRASAILSVAAAVPLDVVDRAAALRSAKGLVSLVWKAGFTMRVAGSVQTAIGQIAPGAVLQAKRGIDFPLGQEEMAWQLDLLSGRGR